MRSAPTSPADDDDGEGTLRVRADAVRCSGRKQAQGGDEHRHHDGAEAQDSAFDGGLFDGVTADAHLVDVFEHDDANLNRDAEECEEADAGGDGEKLVWVMKRASRPPRGAMETLTRIRPAHLPEWNMM